MIDKIFRSSEAITLVGGGAVSEVDLRLALGFAPRLLAADSGAGAILAAGLMPEAVIGDLDSIREQDAARIPSDRIFRIPEQDSTDFEKALCRIEAPFVLAVGFLGLRADHQMAAMNLLVRQRDPACLLIGAHEVVLHLPRVIELDLATGDTVSLFPLAPVAGRSLGLEWPIDGLAFSPSGQIGTSNRATGPVRIETDAPGMLAFLPRERLAQVIESL